jgi:hypothetical protein
MKYDFVGNIMITLVFKRTQMALVAFIGTGILSWFSEDTSHHVFKATWLMLATNPIPIANSSESSRSTTLI